MRTTIDIDPQLLSEAMQLLGVKSKSEAVNRTLAFAVAKAERERKERADMRRIAGQQIGGKKTAS